MKVNKFVGVHEGRVEATAKTMEELEEKLRCLQFCNLNPMFEIYEVNWNLIDACYFTKKSVANDENIECIRSNEE